MNTIQLLAYYVNLLIIQYKGLARAPATIQAQVQPVLMVQTSTQLVSFSLEPSSGELNLTYDGVAVPPIYPGDTAPYIETKIRSVPALAAATVLGNADLSGFTVTFDGVLPPADLLVISSNTMADSHSNAVMVIITETDVTLPVAVENGFDPATAQGVQLDVIGKYVGVARRVQGFTGILNLSDQDFRSLIRIAILSNSSGSSLADIQNLLFLFFPHLIRVYDYQNMRMSYLISSTLGSLDLIESLVVQNLLPRPMAVQISAIIYGPDIDNFFGFCSYEDPTPGGIRPFNTYEDYQAWPWLDYNEAIIF